ncbi:MAG TPA: LysR substrate-binding domain-containing protein [Anaerolineales bacterium]|jgi:LysR family hydrogen peroxide-inducible transcriptional activator
MEIHQLKYFATVAETGSFSRAAERCSIAQPSLSQQIIKLEQELGQPLFHRLGRRVILTDAGQLLLPQAKAILAELQDIRQNLAQSLGDGYGTITAGFIPTVAPFVLPQVIRAFRMAFPHANIIVHEDMTDALVRDLVSGKLDVGFMSLPIHNKMIKTQELLTEPLLVASSRRDGPFSSYASIRVNELDDHPFIALSEMHCLGEQVKAFCFQHEVDLKIVCHASQLGTVHSCVALGLGISLVPQALAVSDPLADVIYQPLSDIVPRRKIVAATRSGRKSSFLVKEFTRLVREEYPTERVLAVAAYENISHG